MPITPLMARRLLIPAGLLAGWLSFSGAPAQDWTQPIPQNPAKQEQSIRDRQAWAHKTLVEAYDKVGKKDPKWDEKARQGLEVVAEMEAESRQPFLRQWDATSHCRQAIERGCDDPLILLTEAILSQGFQEDSTKEVVHRLAKAASLMEKSDYPTIRKIWGFAQAAALAATAENATADERQAAPRQIDEVLRLLPISAAEDAANPLAEVLWKDALEKVLAGRRGVTKEADQSYQWMTDHIPPAPALKLAWLQARSDTLIDYAWEARGDGLGYTVTREGARKMQERLADAKKSIEAAWALKPDDTFTATIAIRVLLGMSRDRAEMEQWYRRAMAADGNNLRACKDKAYWLEPKWHGTPADLREFGRLCGDTKNWQARITLLEPELDLLAASNLGAAPDGAFWTDPEVWTRCRAIFEEFLGYKPNDKNQRARYAAIAYLTGHFAEASEQFAKVGNDLPTDDYFGMTAEWMKQARDTSNAKAKEAKAP